VIDELGVGPVTDVARAMLGWHLVSDVDGSSVEVMLTELEAYAADTDPASHAFRGRTPRNAAMFGRPGTLYVYRSYGIHWCANVVTSEVGSASAVLLRGAAIVSGRDHIVARRARTDHLTDGPGKLCQALGITGAHGGADLTDGPLRLLPGELPAGWRVETTPRIGISKAADRLWRYVATPPR
jgi:DNA-3-methyladenine glycosylase